MRSMLFCPADRPERAINAWRFNPDAVIIDLEESISNNSKDEARINVPKIFDSNPDAEWYVRINSIGSGIADDDLLAVVSRGLKGIIIPKVEDKHEVQYVHEQIKRNAEKRGVNLDIIKLVPTIESVVGITNTRDIATSSTMVFSIGLGGADLALDLGVELNESSDLLKYMMCEIALESRRAKLAPPQDSAYPKYDDDVGLKTACLMARKNGFGTKRAIHPRQISIINAIFSPTEGEIKRATTIKEEYERQIANNDRGVIASNGLMIDYPIYKNALRTIEIAKRDHKLN